MNEYKKLCKSCSRREKNDCAIIALAIVTGNNYNVVKSVLQSKGRKPNQGTELFRVTAALKQLGYDFFEIRDHRHHYGKSLIDTMPFSYQKTLLTMSRHFIPHQKYLVVTTKHIVAVTGGKIQDWSECRRLRIRSIMRVWENEQLY